MHTYRFAFCVCLIYSTEVRTWTKLIVIHLKPTTFVMNKEHTPSVSRVEETMDVQEIIMQYTEQLAENPRLVKTLADICLSFRRNDVDAAIDSLGNYLDWRRQVFGDLSDQMLSCDLKLQQQLQTNFLHLSPVRLSNGAGLLYMSMKLHNPVIYSTADTMKCMHFFILTAMMEDPTLATSGFVFVNNMSDVDVFNLDMGFPAAISAAIGRSVPVRLRKIVIVNPPWLVRFVVPLLKSILPVKLLERLHVVLGPEELPELIDLPNQICLPVDLGGVVEFDTLQHIDRLVQHSWCI